MRAAMQLASAQGIASAVSLRLLAREAGVTHSAFYRHFGSVEELIEAIVADFIEDLRSGVLSARARAQAPEQMTQEVMGWLLDFAVEYRDVFIVATRERFGPQRNIHDLFEEALLQIETDMIGELRRLNLFADTPTATLQRAVRLLSEHALYLCMKHLEAPSQKAERLKEAQLAFNLIIGGLAAMATSA